MTLHKTQHFSGARDNISLLNIPFTMKGGNKK